MQKHLMRFVNYFKKYQNAAKMIILKLVEPAIYRKILSPVRRTSWKYFKPKLFQRRLGAYILNKYMRVLVKPLFFLKKF
jgi:hypothetical protein